MKAALMFFSGPSAQYLREVVAGKLKTGPEITQETQNVKQHLLVDIVL